MIQFSIQWRQTRGCRCDLNIVIFFCGVTHEWMSSVFEVLLLLWFVVMSLSSSWDEMDVGVELLADDVWSAEDDKTGFLSVGVDIFDWLYLLEQPISLPNGANEYNKTKRWEMRIIEKNQQNRNMRFVLWMIKILCLVTPPPLWKNSKNRKTSIN